MHNRAYGFKSGFTIVELLIAIVVIAVLAAISIAAYMNISSRARDSQRLQDVSTITKALEMYYVDHGEFPDSRCHTSCPSPKKTNVWWSTTSDGSWNILEAALVPKYISELPKDPQASTTTDPAVSGGYNYDYIAYGTDCGIAHTQTFRIIYRLESQPQKKQRQGNCPNGGSLYLYSYSGYAVVK